MLLTAPLVSQVHKDARAVVNFITNHDKPLAIYRSKTDLQLVKPADTRFAYQCIVGDRLLAVREALEDTVSSSEFRVWMNSDAKRRESGNYR